MSRLQAGVKTTTHSISARVLLFSWTYIGNTLDTWYILSSLGRSFTRAYRLSFRESMNDHRILGIFDKVGHRGLWSLKRKAATASAIGGRVGGAKVWNAGRDAIHNKFALPSPPPTPKIGSIWRTDVWKAIMFEAIMFDHTIAIEVQRTETNVMIHSSSSGQAIHCSRCKVPSVGQDWCSIATRFVQMWPSNMLQLQESMWRAGTRTMLSFASSRLADHFVFFLNKSQFGWMIVVPQFFGHDIPKEPAKNHVAGYYCFQASYQLLDCFTADLWVPFFCFTISLTAESGWPLWVLRAAVCRCR